MVGDSGERQRLEVVLAEQARLIEGYRRSVGTGEEQSAYFRLRDANARLAEYDRLARERAARAVAPSGR